MRIFGMDSLNSIHENRIDNTYPELNIGYAILSLTRDRITSQTRVVKPYIAIPLRIYGFKNACASLPIASRKLLIRPIVFIPYLNRICPITVNRTLKNSSKKSFISLLYHTSILFTIFNLRLPEPFSFPDECRRSSSVKLNICLFVRMASAFVPERTHAHNITHFDCQISLDRSPATLADCRW